MAWLQSKAKTDKSKTRTNSCKSERNHQLIGKFCDESETERMTHCS